MIEKQFTVIYAIVFPSTNPVTIILIPQVPPATNLPLELPAARNPSIP
jgi:hypothetical protein